MRVYFLLLFFTLIAHAENPAPEKLAQEMGSRITRVPEFEFIREEAQKLGTRVYLFGGTAAAYGHYVRQDLAREAGDKRYPDFLYDYDYTNIFRSTQDLDVVVDGSAEKAAALESILMAKFPHFVGDKDAKWEVRPLREARGDKEAILNNPDFQNQHTDSHSTGLVEITPAPTGELAVKDVRDWNSKEPQFLHDVAEQKLHYYFNPLHETTKRAKEGMNPPILSAIRYLTKAFQYDLSIGGEDRARIEAIVNNFKPSDIKNEYVQKWIEKNGKKLFQHAVNIEQAWDTIQALGLRQKLIDLKKDAGTVDSLAWWMSKEPLRTRSLGQGTGRTAAEIFGKELIVSHEANTYLAHESITRSKSGQLNALISRSGVAGEAAISGEGFYTLLGRRGARGTGFTIRMRLDPNAREGKDFVIGFDRDCIVLKNKAAVRVIPEQIQLSFSGYFRHLAEGKEFSEDDKALLEHFKRKVGRLGLLNAEESAEVLQLAQKEFGKEKPSPSFFREWMSLPMSKDHPEMVEQLIKRGNLDELLVRYVLTQSHWANHPEWLEALIKSGRVDASIARYVLSQPQWANHPEWVEALIKAGRADKEIAQYVLSQSQWKKYPELVEALIKKGTVPHWLEEFVFSQAHWVDHPEWVESFIRREHAEGGGGGLIAKYILSQPQWAAYPELVALLIENGQVPNFIARDVLSQPHWAGHPELVRAMIRKGLQDDFVAAFTLSQAHWATYPELLELLIKKGTAADAITQYILGKPYWLNVLGPALGGKPVTVQNLKALFASGFTFELPMAPIKNCAQGFAAVAR